MQLLQMIHPCAVHTEARCRLRLTATLPTPPRRLHPVPQRRRIARSATESLACPGPARSTGRTPPGLWPAAAPRRWFARHRAGPLRPSPAALAATPQRCTPCHAVALPRAVRLPRPGRCPRAASLSARPTITVTVDGGGEEAVCMFWIGMGSLVFSPSFFFSNIFFLDPLFTTTSRSGEHRGKRYYYLGIPETRANLQR